MAKTLVQAPNGSGGSQTFAVTQNSYDAMGRLSCTAVRMDPAQWNTQTDACVPQTTLANAPDRVTRTAYDAASRVVTVTEGVGTAAPRITLTATYTNNGLTQSVADANANKTTYEYDGFDRLLKTRFPASPLGSNTSSTTDYEQLTYNAASDVMSRRLRDGNVVSFSYDNLHRMTHLSGTPVADRDFVYNLLGEPTSAKYSTSGLGMTWTYDGLGRVLSESQPYGAASYLYNAAGMRTRVTWNDGFYVVYDYDNVGNVTAIRENNAVSGVGVLATYAYAPNTGARTSVTFGNGTVRNYAYDQIVRPTGIGIDLAGTTNDLVLGKVGTVGSNMTYNPASQLTSIVRSNDLYAWRGAINAERNYTPDFLNRYSSVATVTPAQTTTLGYDARGNLTTSTTGTAVTTYTYDALNQMTAGPNGTSMNYDAIGRLGEYNTSVSTRFVYDGSAMIAEVSNPAGAILRRYVHGPGTDEPIVWYEGAGTTDRRFLQADERGSIVAISDSTGAKLGINSYDEYGIPAATNMPNLRFGYTGQTWFPELGLANYKARWYSPTLGRFMQTDPIGYGDGLNLYNYAHSDPVNGRDPSGTTCLYLPHYFQNFEGVIASDRLYFSGCYFEPDPVDRRERANEVGGGGSGGSDNAITVVANLSQSRNTPCGPSGIGTYFGGGAEGGSVLDLGDHTSGIGVAFQVAVSAVNLGNGQNAAFVTTGGLYQAGGYQSSSLAENGAVFGLSAGGSGGLVFTNAQTIDDFSGPATSDNLNIGPIAISYSHNSTGIRTLNIGRSFGFGFSFSSYTTNTAYLGRVGC